MRYQSRAFSCGPAAVCNAFSTYGTYLREDEACEVDVSGTSERALVAGIEKNGRTAECFKARDSVIAINWMNTSIRLGAPVILCVDDWTHWVAVVGIIGDRYLVADSAHEELIIPYTDVELSDRWKKDKRFYAIAVV